MTKLKRFVGVLDYTGAAASLFWGIYQHSWIWLLFGLLGFIVARISPAKYVESFVKRKFIGRQGLTAPTDDELEVNSSLTTEPLALSNEQSPPDFSVRANPDVPIGLRFTVVSFEHLGSFQAYAAFIARKYATRQL